jgi:hypothetical protein
MSGTDTPTNSNIHNKQYDDLLERYGDGLGNIDFNKVDYDALPYDDYVELSYYWSTINYYKPKPEHLKVSYIKRLYAWQEKVEKLEDDVPKHRRFNLTLQVPQLTNAFKKSVRRGEVSKDTLLTIYRVVAQKLLSDPSIADEDIKAMHSVIRSRVSEVYDRRLAKRRRMVR